MKKMRLVLVILIITLATSCSSFNIISTSIFPISLGIDYQDGAFHLIYLIDDKSEKDEREIVKGVGASLAEAESNLNYSIMKSVNPSFIKSIIVTKAVTDNVDFVGLLLYYLADPTFIKSSYLYITDDDLETFYMQTNNLNEIVAYPSLTTKEGIPIRALLRPLTLINITSHYLDQLQRVYLPSLSIDESDHNIYLESTCFTTYQEQFSLQCLSNNDSKGLRWIDNMSGIIITPTGYETTLKGVVSSDHVSYSYSDERIHLKLETSISIASIYDDINPAELKNLFETSISSEIITTYLQAKLRNIDIYNLKGYVRQEHNKDYDLESKLDVRVIVTINTKSHH